MDINDAINSLEMENKQCYDWHNGDCSEVVNGVCTCRDSIILKVLEEYRSRGFQFC